MKRGFRTRIVFESTIAKQQISFALFVCIIIMLTGCDFLPNKSDSDPPGDITELNLQSWNGSVILRWSNLIDEDFDHLLLTRSGTATEYVLGKDTGQFLVPFLTNGTLYSFSIKTVDMHGNVSPGVTISGSPERDGDLKSDLLGGGGTGTPDPNLSVSIDTSGNICLGSDCENWPSIPVSSDGTIDMEAVIDALHEKTDIPKEAIVIEHLSEIVRQIEASGEYKLKNMDALEQYMSDAYSTETDTSTDLTNLTAVVDNKNIILNWDIPSYWALSYIEIAVSSLDDPIKVAYNINSYTLTGLKLGIFHTIRVKTVDIKGRKSAGVSVQRMILLILKNVYFL